MGNSVPSSVLAKPHGTLMPQMPARLAGIVKTSARYICKGSELRFESGDLQGALKIVDQFIPHLMVFPKLN